MQVLKAGKQKAKEAAEQATMTAALKISSNSAGVKMLKQAMARPAKGELRYLVMMWKANTSTHRVALSRNSLVWCLFLNQSSSCCFSAPQPCADTSFPTVGGSSS